MWWWDKGEGAHWSRSYWCTGLIYQYIKNGWVVKHAPGIVRKISSRVFAQEIETHKECKSEKANPIPGTAEYMLTMKNKEAIRKVSGNFGAYFALKFPELLGVRWHIHLINYYYIAIEQQLCIPVCHLSLQKNLWCFCLLLFLGTWLSNHVTGNQMPYSNKSKLGLVFFLL